MEKNIWFLHFDEIVKGPFTTKKILQLLQKSALPANTTIWWKGQSSWMPIQNWRSQLDHILNSFKTETQKSIWYLEYQGSQMGPYPFNELKTLLAQNDSLKSNCHLWTTGLKTWKRIFELPEMIEELGVEQRKDFRAPIKGELSVLKNGKVFQTKPGSISSGGMGFRDLEGLAIGDVVSLTLKSPLLVGPINTKAKVLYTHNNGFTGLQFLNLHPEAHSNIMDYIKQFQTTSPIL